MRKWRITFIIKTFKKGAECINIRSPLQMKLVLTLLPRVFEPDIVWALP